MNVKVLINKSKLFDDITKDFGSTYGYYVYKILDHYTEKQIVKSCYNDIRKKLNELSVIKEEYIDVQEVLDTTKKYFATAYEKCRNKKEEKAVMLCQSSISDVIRTQFSVVYS